MRRDLAAILGAAALIAVLVMPQPAPQPVLELVHWDSQPAVDGFIEVFQVRAVRAPIDSQEVVVVLDGAPIAVNWTSPGRLQPGLGFSFQADAFDALHHIEVAWRGTTVWSLDFGGGTGTPVA